MLANYPLQIPVLYTFDATYLVFQLNPPTQRYSYAIGQRHPNDCKPTSLRHQGRLPGICSNQGLVPNGRRGKHMPRG